ncbi:MAG: 1-deoxy-D-xylulose-5-phosphate reductoisomerase [bacterium]
MKKMKRVCILGSTGSIGQNCLSVVQSQSHAFEVRYLTTYQNTQLLLQQANKFRPQAVAIFDKEKVRACEQRFKEIGVAVYGGLDGLLEISRQEDVDIVVNALVGAVGLQPTLHAILPGRRIALANKETLVVGGELVMEKARKVGAEVIPIDSEHSALLQCLIGEQVEHIRKVILTASGGPFRQRAASEFCTITVAEALDHPNWDMGPKITIDSATMMNKGLEVIEARWLFNLEPRQIEVVVHPQSIIHSLVEFRDGSLKAQLGLPDMRVPIQYALTFPGRMPARFPCLDFQQVRELTFEPPDLDKFPCLKLSVQALEQGGAAPAVLNASNEQAVHLFLQEKIRFDQIHALVEDALAHCTTNGCLGVDELLEVDRSAREYISDKYE